MSVTRSPFRSPVRGPTQSPFGAGRLLERTRTFRDRVKNESGSIEDGSLEDLYDPILRKIKDWGLLSDLVFFGSGSAVEINSGSIPTLFDASGNENDATQTDTSKQPALNKNGIGGRWEASGDESDDVLNVLINPDSTATVIVVGAISGSGAAIIGQPHIFEDSGSWAIYYGGSVVSGGSHDTNPHDFAARYDGSGSRLRVDGTEALSGDPGSGASSDTTLMNDGGSGRPNGREGALWMVFDGVTLTTDQENDLRTIARDYYSL